MREDEHLMSCGCETESYSEAMSIFQGVAVHCPAGIIQEITECDSGERSVCGMALIEACK